MNVELVHVETCDGLVLSGTLRLPEAGTERRFAIECVVLHHGGGGKFYGPHPLYDTLASGFLAAGCAVLRVNNRGHDMLYHGPRGLQGFSVDIADECRHDWAAWNDLAASQGFHEVAVVGHSMGAVKSIYYTAKVPDERVRCVVASAPPRFSHAAYLALEGGDRFADDYATAKRLAAEDSPHAIFRASTPIPIPVSARCFLDRHDPDDRYDFVRHLPNVPVPILVTVGDEAITGPKDPFWFDFAGHRDLLPGIARDLPLMTFEHIAGAGHTLDGPAAARAWTVMSDWLDRTVPA